MEVNHAFIGLRVDCLRLCPGGKEVDTISLNYLRPGKPLILAFVFFFVKYV